VPAKQVDLSGTPDQAVVDGFSIEIALADNQEFAAIPQTQSRGSLRSAILFVVLLMPDFDPILDRTPDFSLVSQVAPVSLDHKPHRCQDFAWK